MIFSYIYKSMIYRHLLADAELAKDVAQNFIGGYLPGNFPEVEHALTDIL